MHLFFRCEMGDFIQVNVSNSHNDVVSFEKKFPKDMKISELKVIIPLNEFNLHLVCYDFCFIYIFIAHSCDSTMPFNGIDQIWDWHEKKKNIFTETQMNHLFFVFWFFSASWKL